MWHLSAPRSAVFARDLGLSVEVWGEVLSAGFPGPEALSPGLSSDLKIRRHHLRRPPCVPHRHARRAVRASEAGGRSLHHPASPVSPEGDHFPRTPMMRTYVVSPPPAPAPPRQHACRCIRGRNGKSMGTGLGDGDVAGVKWLIFGGWGCGCGVSKQ